METDKKYEWLKPVIPIDVDTIQATYNEETEWVLDPNGFFTIKPFPKEGVIKVRFYTNDAVCQKLIIGKTPEQIWHTLIREGLLVRLDHAAYIGSELRKAYIALKHDIEFNQDYPFDITKKNI